MTWNVSYSLCEEPMEVDVQYYDIMWNMNVSYKKGKHF